MLTTLTHALATTINTGLIQIVDISYIQCIM